MDWPTYKQLCNQPDYWSRWMLEQCVDLLDQLDEKSLKKALALTLSGKALAIPADHRGPAATSMYQLNLSVDQRKAFLQALQLASERGLRSAQTRQRGLGGFVAACREYAGYGGEGASD